MWIRIGFDWRRDHLKDREGGAQAGAGGGAVVFDNLLDGLQGAIRKKLGVLTPEQHLIVLRASQAILEQRRGADPVTDSVAAHADRTSGVGDGGAGADERQHAFLDWS